MNYDAFSFREDNRDRIDNSHVDKLIASIKSRNMLDLRPILVNDKMQIIDGQHRLLAAKSLQVEIYYKIEKTLSSKEIILMNISKQWRSADYLNFYVKNGYEEYEKLKDFISRNRITLKVALNITMGQTHDGYLKFKAGDYIFNNEIIQVDVNICWETIEVIKRLNGFSPYTNSARFWRALLLLIRLDGFNNKKWQENLQRMIGRFCVRATIKDYLKLFMETYNYRNSEKIYLLGDE